LRKARAVLWLFLGLVGAPVGAAVYLGTAGLERERAFLVGEEADALGRSADKARDELVRELLALARTESDRDYLHYLPEYVPVLPGRVQSVRLPSPLATQPQEGFRPFADRFQLTPSGRLTTPAGEPSQEVRQLVASPAARKWFADPVEPARRDGVPVVKIPRSLVLANRRLAEGETTAEVDPNDAETMAVVYSGFAFEGEFAVRVVQFEDGYRLVQGFRVDVDALARATLPAIPSDERIERTEMLRDDEAPRPQLDSRGLPVLAHRAVWPEGRYAGRLLLPRGPYLLVLRLRASPALDRALVESGARVRTILTAMAVVVLLGFAFAWRAVRAETVLASRRSEFVSAVSHELRTPLTSIRMYADMLKEGWVKDETTAKDYFALISAESERLARLVNNVLDFSRIERGKKTFDMRVGDPAPVVRETAELLRPYLKEKGFALDLAVPEALPPCSFDRDALTQILVNLMDNAVKYGEGRGTREVRVDAQARDARVVLRVMDRGHGVPTDERERIFLPFHRGRNAAAAGGSGLGLALVRHYALAHGGRVDVRDRDGGGAEFALAIPVAP